LRSNTNGANARGGVAGLCATIADAVAVPSRSIQGTERGHSVRRSSHSGGIPARPLPAPTIPPTIAASVSVSPPHAMAVRTAAEKSRGNDNHAWIATGTVWKT